MRVLVVAPSLGIGGAERVLTTTLPALDRENIDISLVCVGEEGELFADLTAMGVRATALHAGGKRNTPNALIRLSNHIRKTKPDVVVTLGGGVTVTARLAAALNRVKHRIVWVHSSSERRRWILRVADRSLIPVTTGYLGVAEAQREFMVHSCRYPADRIHIVRNGVDLNSWPARTDRTPLAEFGIQPDAPVVGMVARLHPVKDHDTFLAAASLLIRELPQARFLVVGDGSRRSELESQRRKMGLDHAVHFTGFRDDVAQLLCAMDAVVLSSHSESLPLSVLEAMACGKPVICTEIGGTSEIIENGVSGFLTRPQEPMQIADHLNTLLTNREFARSMGLAARRRVESAFSLEDSVAQLETFFLELHSSNHPEHVGN